MYDIKQITLSDGDRHYEISEQSTKNKPKKYKSVTTIIDKFKPKAALFKWKKEVGEEKAKEISNKASSRGNKVHYYIEQYFLNNKTINFSTTEDKNYIFFDKLLPVLNKIEPKKWIEEDKETFGIEKKVFWENNNIGFGGSVDICGTIDTSNLTLRNKNIILPKKIDFIGDWKTWNKVKYPLIKSQEGNYILPLLSYYLQLSAYCAAVNQYKKEKINQCFLFGVTETCRSPFIYYLNPKTVNFYWSKMKELVYCYYSNEYFNWDLMEYEVIENNFIGERVDIKNE